jgi:hypothetical protein
MKTKSIIIISICAALLLTISGWCWYVFSIPARTLAFAIAVVIAIGFALYFELRYSAAVSAQAVLAFNSQNLHKPFHIVGINIGDFLEIYAYVILISLASAIVPLLDALKRNPGKDMREE